MLRIIYILQFTHAKNPKGNQVIKYHDKQHAINAYKQYKKQVNGCCYNVHLYEATIGEADYSGLLGKSALG